MSKRLYARGLTDTLHSVADEHVGHEIRGQLYGRREAGFPAETYTLWARYEQKVEVHTRWGVREIGLDVLWAYGIPVCLTCREK